MARRSREGAVLSAILVTCLCASGALDLARAVDLRTQPKPFTDTSGLAAAAWVRTHTDARAHLATSANITDPVMDLSGRRTVIGTAWLMLAWGLTDYPQRGRDLEAILRGSPDAAVIAHREGVSYVVLGPQEPAAQRTAAATYWDGHGTLAYHNDEHRIYRVRPSS